MIHITKDQNHIAYNIQEYMLDFATDVENLPLVDCAPGSAAYVIETGDIYIKNGQKEWVKQ